MRRLIRTQGLAVECSEGLTQLCRLFSDIDDIELDGRLFAWSSFIETTSSTTSC